MSRIKQLSAEFVVVTDTGARMVFGFENSPGPKDGLKGLGEYIATKCQAEIDRLFELDTAHMELGKAKDAMVALEKQVAALQSAAATVTAPPKPAEPTVARAEPAVSPLTGKPKRQYTRRN